MAASRGGHVARSRDARSNANNDHDAEERDGGGSSNRCTIAVVRRIRPDLRWAIAQAAGGRGGGGARPPTSCSLNVRRGCRDARSFSGAAHTRQCVRFPPRPRSARRAARGAERRRCGRCCTMSGARATSGGGRGGPAPGRRAEATHYTTVVAKTAETANAVSHGDAVTAAAGTPVAAATLAATSERLNASAYVTLMHETRQQGAPVYASLYELRRELPSSAGDDRTSGSWQRSSSGSSGDSASSEYAKLHAPRKSPMQGNDRQAASGMPDEPRREIPSPPWSPSVAASTTGASPPSAPSASSTPPALPPPRQSAHGRETQGALQADRPPQEPRSPPADSQKPPQRADTSPRPVYVDLSRPNAKFDAIVAATNSESEKQRELRLRHCAGALARAAAARAAGAPDPPTAQYADVR